MGAHNFEDQEYGATAAEAFRDLCDTATYEYGHNPYNGTISTTSGYVSIPLNEGESINEWAQRVIDDDRVQKWEDCACAKDPDEEEVSGRWLWHFAGWAAC